MDLWSKGFEKTGLPLIGYVLAKRNTTYHMISYVCNDVCTVFHTQCIRCYAITSIMTGQGPRNHSQPLTNVGLSFY